MSSTDEQLLMNRREAIQRVSVLLGGIALVGGSGVLAACAKDRPAATAGATVGAFTSDDIAFLDEVADTILPTTTTPGAKAAATGAFMALAVTDGYDARDQQVFRDGIRALDDASKKMHNTGFMQATPAQRLALLETLDREQKTYTDARNAALTAAHAAENAAGAAHRDTTKTADEKKGDALLPDGRKEGAANANATGGASAITGDSPAHYFRMMKELAMLGYFTSEIGYTQAMRYVESPGRFDPCLPYAKGEKSWAGHA